MVENISKFGLSEMMTILRDAVRIKRDPSTYLNAIDVSRYIQHRYDKGVKDRTFVNKTKAQNSLEAANDEMATSQTGDPNKARSFRTKSLPRQYRWNYEQKNEPVKPGIEAKEPSIQTLKEFASLHDLSNIAGKPARMKTGKRPKSKLSTLGLSKSLESEVWFQPGENKENVLKENTENPTLTATKMTFAKRSLETDALLEPKTSPTRMAAFNPNVSRPNHYIPPNPRAENVVQQEAFKGATSYIEAKRAFATDYFGSTWGQRYSSFKKQENPQERPQGRKKTGTPSANKASKGVTASYKFKPHSGRSMAVSGVPPKNKLTALKTKKPETPGRNASGILRKPISSKKPNSGTVKVLNLNFQKKEKEQQYIQKRPIEETARRSLRNNVVIRTREILAKAEEDRKLIFQREQLDVLRALAKKTLDCARDEQRKIKRQMSTGRTPFGYNN